MKMAKKVNLENKNTQSSRIIFNFFLFVLYYRHESFGYHGREQKICI